MILSVAPRPVCPGVPPPGPIQFPLVESDSLTVSWSPPEGAPGPYRYIVIWRRGQEQRIITVAGLSLKVTDLTPGEIYHFRVATLSECGLQSNCVEMLVNTGETLTQVRMKVKFSYLPT